MIFLFSSFLLICLVSSALASTDSTITDPIEIFNDLLDEPDEETDASNIYERLEELLKDPVNINTAGIDELEKIPYVTFQHAQQIIEHRKNFGYFFSVSELNSIKTLPSDLIRNIIPYITTESKTGYHEIPQDFFSIKNLYKDIKLFHRSRYLSDLQLREGYKNKRFAGSKSKIYNRILLKHKNYQLGFTTDKDPGEKDFAEFSSFHISINEIGIIDNLIVGDYLIEFGQGLAIWSPYGFNKGGDAVYPLKKKNRNIRAYTSTDENKFLRGSAASISLGSFRLTGFYSFNKLDAGIDEATGLITSTPIDGYHRTEGELLRRKAAKEKLLGGVADFKSDNINLGLISYFSEFSNSFQPSAPFGIEGNKFNYTSISYDIFFDNLNLFGESSYNGTSVASIASIQIGILRKLIFLTSVRNYPRNYINLHGFGFGERSGAAENEVGIYNGLQWSSPIGRINIYFDQFKFPGAVSNLRLPSEGNEFLADYSSKPIKNFEIKFRYKIEKKNISISNGLLTSLSNQQKENIRGELIYTVSKYLRLKGRFEVINYTIPALSREEHGFMFFQDARLAIFNQLTVYTRMAYYKTDSFNAAIYTYENDLRGVLSSVALYDEGMRWYITLSFVPTKGIILSGKYSETFKPRKKFLSSGNSMIMGNLDNRFGLQIDVSF
jgi:hypothetical protein